MKLSRRSSYSSIFIALTALVLVTITNSFSQRKNEIVSAYSALLRNQENGYELSSNQLGTILSPDSNNLVKSNRVWIVVKKVGSGFLMGSVFSFTGAFVGASFFRKDPWSSIGGAIIGSYVGYIYGASYGVHLISEHENPESSFVLTLVSGFLSIGGTYVVYSVTDNNTLRGSALLVFPIAFPIIFTELIE